METRSKLRARPPATEDSTRGPQESFGSGSPSEENLNLTVVLGDAAAGIVGTSCPRVDSASTSPEKIASEHEFTLNLVSEPACNSNVNETAPRQIDVATPVTPPTSSRLPTLISCRPGASADEGVVSGFSLGNVGMVPVPFSGSLGVQVNKENVSPRTQKSVSQYGNADDEYFL